MIIARIFKNKNFQDLGLIFVLGLTPLLWFTNEKLIMGGDLDFPLEPITNFIKYLYLWNPGMFMGFDDSIFIPKQIPYNFMLALLDFMGLSLQSIQKVVFVFLFMSSGFSIYYLALSLAPMKEKRIVGLTSAIFYMFNLRFIFLWHDFAQTLIFAYSFMPLALALFIKCLSSGEKKYILLFGVSSLLYATSATNPPMLISIFIPIFLYYMCYSIFKKKVFTTFKLGFTIVLIYVLINLWWILPLVNNLANPNSLMADKEASYGILRLNSAESSILNLFSLLGYWAFYSDGVRGVPYYLFSEYYHTHLMLIFIYIVPLLAFMALMFLNKNRYIPYFAFLSLLGIFLSKGVHEPLSYVNYFLYDNVPFFLEFRSAYIKFSHLITLGYSFLLGIVAYEIYFKLELMLGGLRYSKFVPICSIILLNVIFILISFPLITGDVYPEKTYPIMGNATENSFYTTHVEVPPYYYETAELLNRDTDDFKVLLLPFQPGYSAYTWGFQGAYIETHIINKSLIVGAPMGGYTNLDNLTLSLFRNLRSNQTDSIGNYLNLMNIKYILIRDDIDYKFYGSDPQNYLKNILNHQKEIKFIKKIGEIEIYQTKNYAPLIFSTHNIMLTNAPTPMLLSSTPSELFSYFNSQAIFSIPENRVKQIDYVLNLSSIYLIYPNANSTYKNTSMNKSSFSELQNIIPENVIQYNVSIPKRADYEIYLDLQKNSTRVSPIYSVDGISYDTNINKSKNGINLEKGNHSICVEGLQLEDINFFFLYAKHDPLHPSPIINYQRINPTKYKVRVTNATSPFVIVFSESFHPQWRAYINRNGKQVSWFESLYKKPISEEKHLLVNGYANAWYIDPIELGTGENFTVTLYFKPQSYFYIGLIISGLTFIGCVGYLVWGWRKRTHKNITWLSIKKGG